jgi:diguanylate cyclase (GGDEF)-like protein
MLVIVSACAAVYTIAAGTFAYAFNDVAPPLVDGDHLSTFTSRFIGPFVLLSGTLTLALWIATTRLRRAIDIWVVVALFALTLDVLVTIHSTSTGSIGWLAGRVLWAGCSGAVLVQMVGKLYSVVLGLIADNQSLETQATTDELTQLPNRRAFNRATEAIFAEHRRDDRKVALIMIDIDEFKRYNDAFGHAAGDEALKTVAAIVQSTVSRARDIAARWGGEEIAVLLRDADLAGAALVAERIRQRVEEAAIAHDPAAIHASLTVSIGVASTIDTPSIVTFDQLAASADAALYAAKAGGRNRISTGRPALSA